MTQKRLFIIHGYTATPQNHWFNWLKAQAGLLGMEVIVPALPNTTAPQESEWVAELARQVGTVDENTWFVGHSLGCITVLRFLSRQQHVAAGIIMVSGFSEPVDRLPELDGFTATPLDNLQVISKIPHRAVIASLDDDIVPADYSLRLSQQINAPLFGLPNGGHFLDRQGFDTLPLVADLLNQYHRQEQNQ